MHQIVGWFEIGQRLGRSVSTMKAATKQGNLGGITPPQIWYTDSGKPWTTDSEISSYIQRAQAAGFPPGEPRGASAAAE